MRPRLAGVRPLRPPRHRLHRLGAVAARPRPLGRQEDGRAPAALGQRPRLREERSGPHDARYTRCGDARRRRLDRACARVAPRGARARQLDALRAGLAHGVPGKAQALGCLRRAHRERRLLRGAKRVLRLPRAAPAGQPLLAALCGAGAGDAAALAGALAAAAGQRRARPAGGQARAGGPDPRSTGEIGQNRHARRRRCRASCRGARFEFPGRAAQCRNQNSSQYDLSPHRRSFQCRPCRTRRRRC